MRRLPQQITTFVLILACSAPFAGCERKRPSAPPIDKTAAVGKWLEIDAAEYGNVRIQSDEPLKFKRQIVLKDDGTFEFSIVTSSGAPHGSEKVEGTWDVDTAKNQIVFSVTKNQFGQKDERHGWAPATSKGVYKEHLGKEGEVDAITMTDTDGAPVAYKRIK